MTRWRGSGAGVGLYYATSVTLVNTVIAHSTTGEAFAGSGTKVLDHCNLFGNAVGDWVGDIAGQLGVSGNICLDPLLVDAPGGDCHLRYDSPCRDAGTNAAPGLPGEDCEGDPREAANPYNIGLGGESIVGDQVRVWRSGSVRGFVDVPRGNGPQG